MYNRVVNVENQLRKGSTPILILSVLADGPLHGYAIAREVERRSADALAMGEGALYPTLRAMEDEGLLVGDWETPASGAPRRVYRLTEAGQTQLAAQVQVWRKFTDAVNNVIGGWPHAKPV